MAGISSGRVRDIKLRPGAENIIPLANGTELRVEPFRRKGRMWLRVFDAATGEKIQTVKAGAVEAIGSAITGTSKGSNHGS